MDINRVYVTLDEMLEAGQNAEAEDFLIEMMKEASAEGDNQSLIMLLNEMIGFCRETGQKDKSIAYSFQVVELEQRLGMEGTVGYATTLLNVANALRAAGKLQEAYRFYMEVFPIYDANLRPDDFYYASLYNNLSLLLQEMGDYEQAIECLQKALVLAQTTQGKEFEEYVTHANIASTLCKLSEQEREKEKAVGLITGAVSDSRSTEIARDALAEAEEAINGFIHEQVKDQHMAAALTAYADACLLLGKYRDAVRYLKDAADMVESVVGRTEAYDRVKQKLEYAKMLELQKASEAEKDDGYGDTAGEDESVSEVPEGHIPGLALSESYFEKFGKKMLFDNFGPYLDRIAVGLCGEGSECLGFDDEISTDHDFGPGFCMWVTRETYDEIGKRLQEEYDRLPKSFMGYERIETREGSGRCGVCVIDDFFKRILGTDKFPETTDEWLAIPESALLAATSGQIFSDPEEIFTKMQVYLSGYYPEEAWRRLIAQYMTLFSQYGQYNYERALQRGDRAAATLMIVKATEYAIHLCYLLNREYAPHDKWLLKGMEEFEILPMAEDIMTALLNNPDVHKEAEGVDRIELIEKLAGMFLSELKKQGLIPAESSSTYLADYGRIVAFSPSVGRDVPAAEDAASDQDRSEKTKEALSKIGSDEEYTKEDLVDAVVRMEYEAFDEVENEGGRAECQDNWTTFEIMRKSQYLTWNKEMLEQFIVDFKVCMDKG
ncbi:MAG: DUF4125 family protein, partial [Lachnospiraceae bacterium]|nr:DUF4125 family protein [Lachnospiraceae bacterium]